MGGLELDNDIVSMEKGMFCIMVWRCFERLLWIGPSQIVVKIKVNI